MMRDCLLVAVLVGLFVLRDVSAELKMPEGIVPADVAALPFNPKVGFMKEIYDSGIGSMVVGLRRAMHEVPGVMYEEYFASDTVYRTLIANGFDESNIKTGLGITGVIAHIGKGSLESSLSGGDANVPTILLRADMDALPIQEETDVPFKSTVANVMHACGHDAHTAMLLGAALVLKQHESELISKGGAVRLFFQPAEEGGAGAKAMIDEGAIEGADAAIMLHVGSQNDVGKFQSTRGRTNCSCHTFHIVITGVGAHGANPHQSKDPVAAAAAVVSGGEHFVLRSHSHMKQKFRSVERRGRPLTS